MTANTENETKPALPVWARIVLVIFSFILMTGIFQLLGMLLLHVSIHDRFESQAISLKQNVILTAIGLIPLTLIIYTFRKFIDRKSIMSMGFSLQNRTRDIVTGFLVAITLFIFGSFILVEFNAIGLTYIGFDLSSFLLSLVLFTIVAFNEEILMRGYILNNLMSSTNKYMALLISAVIFSILHGLNANISLLAFVNLMLAGIILGSTYIFTKNLWFPISLHLFWNFFQGPVLGYSVSGMKISSIFKVTLRGSNTVNGGQFGFEGSLVCTVLLIIAISLIIGYYLEFFKKSS
jgi:membrane protease YdiL (CAAX protease family)